MSFIILYYYSFQLHLTSYSIFIYTSSSAFIIGHCQNTALFVGIIFIFVTITLILFQLFLFWTAWHLDPCLSHSGAHVGWRCEDFSWHSDRIQPPRCAGKGQIYLCCGVTYKSLVCLFILARVKNDTCFSWLVLLKVKLHLIFHHKGFYFVFSSCRAEINWITLVTS